MAGFVHRHYLIPFFNRDIAIRNLFSTDKGLNALMSAKNDLMSYELDVIFSSGPAPARYFDIPGLLYMTKTFTYTQARARLASLCKDVTDDSDYVIITRRGHEDVALISASELSSLIETAHLLGSPKNAERLATALNRAKASTEPTQSIDDLCREVGLK